MDERFQLIRTLLAQPPSWERWNRLVEILDQWPSPSTRQVALDYLREHFDDAWAYRWRLPNASWPGDSCGWGLARTESRELRTYPEGQLVFCPPGTYLPGIQRGNHESLPERVGFRDLAETSQEVSLSRPFWCLSTPVTVGMWVHAMRPESPLNRNHFAPMTRVNWQEALVFCNALSRLEGLEPCYQFPEESAEFVPGEVRWIRSAEGYRLPTSAEWEWACRAGSDTLLYGPLSDIAQHFGNADSLQPVAQKKPNAWHLFDMIGNVFEWCWDGVVASSHIEGEEASQTSPTLDPSGDERSAERVVRGGSYLSPSDSLNAVAGRALRWSQTQEDLGFRVIRNGTV